MLTVVGLGNPGAAYRNSRHNVGFMLLDGIVEGRFINNAGFQQSGIPFLRRLLGKKTAYKKKSGPYVGCEGDLHGKTFYLVKPTTFMNESGKALHHLKRRGIIRDLSEMLVVVDDVDLDTGRVRLRASGSGGGHKGLNNIIVSLGTGEFARLRIGVGPRPDGEDLVRYVLGNFHPGEKELLDKSLEVASAIVEAWITGGFEKAKIINTSV